MPSEAPGQRVPKTATKATSHGAPVVEEKVAGVAFKSQRAAPAAPNGTNATAAQQIAIGERFVIMVSGRHELASSLLPGGAAAGNMLYIKASDNSIALAATALTTGLLNAGWVPWGLLESIDTVAARFLVNLNLRSIV